MVIWMTCSVCGAIKKIMRIIIIINHSIIWEAGKCRHTIDQLIELINYTKKGSGIN